MSSNKKVKVITHVADLIKPKKNYSYPCYCVRCKGMEVNSRTQEKHTKEKILWKSKTSRKHQKNAIEIRKKKNSITLNVNSIETNLCKKRKRDSYHHTPASTFDRNSHHDILSHTPSPSKSKSSSRFHALHLMI
jgi:hypothetical protein